MREKQQATGNRQQATGNRQQVQQYFVDVIPSGSYLVKENSSEASARTFDQKESEAWRGSERKSWRD